MKRNRESSSPTSAVKHDPEDIAESAFVQSFSTTVEVYKKIVRRVPSIQRVDFSRSPDFTTSGGANVGGTTSRKFAARKSHLDRRKSNDGYDGRRYEGLIRRRKRRMDAAGGVWQEGESTEPWSHGCTGPGNREIRLREKNGRKKQRNGGTKRAIWTCARRPTGH